MKLDKRIVKILKWYGKEDLLTIVGRLPRNHREALLDEYQLEDYDSWGLDKQLLLATSFPVEFNTPVLVHDRKIKVDYLVKNGRNILVVIHQYADRGTLANAKEDAKTVISISKALKKQGWNPYVASVIADEEHDFLHYGNTEWIDEWLSNPKSKPVEYHAFSNG